MDATIRSIRSFVLRQGRFSPAQQRAYEMLMPRFGLPFSPTFLDLEAVFGRKAPKILEIGFGMGETTAKIASEHPENDYLGVEVHSPGVGALLKLVDERALTNIRVIQHDAVEVVRDMLPPESLSGVHVFFPDPWPKKRHHKRRLIQPAFAELLSSRLAPGGYLHAATDWQEYAEHILATLSGVASLENPHDGFASRPETRPETKFELRGRRLGHGSWDVIFRKRPARAGDRHDPSGE
jgi:tRNA (guanine-N7-)-methyltransferase